MKNQKAETRNQKGAARAAAIALFWFLVSGFCFGQAHSDPLRGPQRYPSWPRGSCVQCHDQQPQRRGDNELCFTCHETPVGWTQSSHTKCLECHDPHGSDAAMLKKREGELCLQCHDDVRRQLTRSFRHGMEARGKHDPAEGGDPAKFAALPSANRHVSCSDCHNAHQARGTLLAGVSRVEVNDGRYTWRDADDLSPANEYEICFKCHSGWTRLGPGQPDLALLTSPSNASFHPIRAAGKNEIVPRAFAPGAQMSSQSLVACTSCHGSDDETARGPHASSNRGLLRRAGNELCFTCHAADVYGNAAADAEAQRASRFSGHGFHTAQQIECAACHDPHGSARHAALIVTGRMPGLGSFTQTATGGTCTSSCHAPRTYSVSYAR